jgi:hypothetical protein
MPVLPPGECWSKNVEVVAYCDLDAKPAFKLAIHAVGGRWYLYIAHLWHPGWSVLDVTDPDKPRTLRHIKGPDNTWTIQVQVAEGKMITALERMPPPWGGDPSKPYEESVLIWDLADPQQPVVLSQYRVGVSAAGTSAGPASGSGTHRNFYDGGRYMHLSLKRPGFARNIYQIVDIGDPRNPRDVARWWAPGQWIEGGEQGGSADEWLHGGAYVEGDRAYLPYGSAGMIILDISDMQTPRLIGQLRFSPPFNPHVGNHSAVPIPSRKLVVVNSEAIKEHCAEPLNYAGLVDVSDERSPRLMSLFPVPEAPPGAPFRNFCERGGRFGPHNQHQHQHQPSLMQNDNLVFMTYFNAGLRIFDISDATLPREVAYFVPPDPRERRGPLPTTLVAQSEDVLVDARGFIYISDKNHGVYIVKASDSIYRKAL